jgi:hypothetical protein
MSDSARPWICGVKHRFGTGFKFLTPDRPGAVTTPASESLDTAGLVTNLRLGPESADGRPQPQPQLQPHPPPRPTNPAVAAVPRPFAAPTPAAELRLVAPRRATPAPSRSPRAAARCPDSARAAGKLKVRRRRPAWPSAAAAEGRRPICAPRAQRSGEDRVANAAAQHTRSAANGAPQIPKIRRDPLWESAHTGPWRAMQRGGGGSGGKLPARSSCRAMALAAHPEHASASANGQPEQSRAAGSTGQFFACKKRRQQASCACLCIAARAACLQLSAVKISMRSRTMSVLVGTMLERINFWFEIATAAAMPGAEVICGELKQPWMPTA